MKSASMLTLSLTAATATLFTACLFEGDPSKASQATARIEMKATASTSALAKTSAASGLILGDTSGIQIELSEARLLVSRIKLESEDEDGTCDSVVPALKKDGDSSESEHETECEDDAEFSVRGPFVIDLLTGTSTPDIASITVPAGIYRKLKIELHHGGSDDSSGLRDSTLVAKGTFTLPGGAPVPFSIALGMNENLKIENPAGIVLDGSTVNTILIQLMAGDWLKGADLTRCLGTLDSASLSGGISITETSTLGKCLDAEHILKDNFRKSFHAEERDDHDDDDIDEDDDNSGKDSSEHSGTHK